MKEFYYRKSIVLWLYQLNLTERVQNLQYAIRDVVAQAKQLEKNGKDVIYLNIGDPPMFDFKTPNHIKEALIQAVKEEKQQAWISSCRNC